MEAAFSRLRWPTLERLGFIYYSDLVDWLLCTNIEYLMGWQRGLDESEAISINYVMKISTGMRDVDHRSAVTRKAQRALQHLFSSNLLKILIRTPSHKTALLMLILRPVWRFFSASP
ncbi:hypothetical protein Zmor_013093 [Zophobas morio]|uniref:Uncharacterized protein n=1 Tax=Zophobas morio TaxID=2755281 RepID=A0AA38IH44_9CUCU|nr:hypothetical protein Zmor_013093 [Zophobas morio]